MYAMRISKAPISSTSAGLIDSGRGEFWVVWEEDGKYPDLIIEHLSHSTAKADRTTKKELYEKTFHTQEYYCYDPYSRKLDGWSLVDGQYQAAGAQRARLALE